MIDPTTLRWEAYNSFGLQAGFNDADEIVLYRTQTNKTGEYVYSYDAEILDTILTIKANLVGGNNFTGNQNINSTQQSDRNKIYFVGDSITYGYSATDNSKRYSTILSNILGLLEDNQGEVGLQMLQYANSYTPPEKSSDGKYFVLALGINDIVNNPTITESEFQDACEQVISNIISQGWDYNDIIISNTVYIGSPSSKQIDFNNVLETIANDNSIKFINIFDKMSINGGINLIADGLHPNNQGHYVIASTFAENITKEIIVNEGSLNVGGNSFFDKIKIFPNQSINNSGNSYVLGCDQYGNVGLLLSLPDNVRTKNMVFDGSLLSANALIPFNISLGDILLQEGKGIISATNNENVVGKIIPMDLDGHTKYRNYFVNGDHIFYTSGGIIGNQVEALRFGNGGVVIGFTKQIYSEYNPGEGGYLQLFDGSGNTNYKNKFITGKHAFYSSNGIGGTETKTVEISEKGRVTIQNGGDFPVKAAKLALNSTSEGFLVPRMTTSQRDDIGRVISIIVTNAGTGYTSPPSVVISGGGGTGATAEASLPLLSNSITITSQGSGYTSVPTVTLTGGGGSGALAVAIVDTEIGLEIFNSDSSRKNIIANGSWKEIAYLDDIQNVNIVNSGASLDLSLGGFYTFSGTTATWTLPGLSGNTGKRYLIMNQGTGIITINTNTGSNEIYMGGALVNMITVGVGEIAVLYNNSLSWFRQL